MWSRANISLANYKLFLPNLWSPLLALMLAFKFGAGGPNSISAPSRLHFLSPLHCLLNHLLPALQLRWPLARKVGLKFVTVRRQRWTEEEGPVPGVPERAPTRSPEIRKIKHLRSIFFHRWNSEIFICSL